MTEKIAPVQGYTPGIPWEMHLRAYDVYRKKYGAQEALIEGWCRGGFGTSELDEFIPGWREELSERAGMRRDIERLRAALTEISKHYGNQDMNHVDYRVMAKTLADEALAGQADATTR